MEIPLFVTSAHGDEVQCFDRSSGNLQWKQTLPAAAVSAHLWRRQSAMEIDLHAHDQAELVVASDSTALAAAASLGTVHVHKHDKGLYARLHPPMRVPAHVAKSIMEVTGAGQSKSVGPGISPQTSSLSTHVRDMTSLREHELLVKRNQNELPDCKPKSPGYPDCLIGTYDIGWPHGDISDQQGILRDLGGDPSASQEQKWPDNEFLEMGDHNANRREQMQLLLRLASQSPGLFIGLVLFLVLLGWFLGRGGGTSTKPDPRFPEPRLSEASSSHSLRDLSHVHPLIENCAFTGDDTGPNSDDKDSGLLSKATTPGEEEAAIEKVSSLDMSASSWGKGWGERSGSFEKASKGNASFSYTESDDDDFLAESQDTFSGNMMNRNRSNNSRLASNPSSRLSKASTHAASNKKQTKGGKRSPKLYIPDSTPVWPPNMNDLCAQIDGDSTFGSRRRRAMSNVGLSREGSRSDKSDDESWAGDYVRPRSISLGSTLSTRTRDDLQDDVNAALAACGLSAPNSPKPTPAVGFPSSPGFPGGHWNETRYQKDFEELERIGKGAFGSVFKVKGRLDEKMYAVKKVRLEKDPKSADNQRIMREVRSFSILSDHPKIVRYYAGWQETEMPQNNGQILTLTDGSSEVTWDASSMFGDESEITQQGETEPVNWLYIQMELCQTSLRQLLNAGSGWTVDSEKIRRYLHDVSEGLSYIHSKHYIHRDMKPDNIFIVDNLGSFVAKLGDFGLSCKTQPERAEGGAVDRHTPVARESSRHLLSINGSLSDENMDEASLAELTRACGTRMYFSPELEHSGVYNQLVDVYALGIVLFEMMHVFKTGMERIKVIEQLKQSMCTSAGAEYSNLPIKYVFVHSDASTSDGNTRTSSPQSKSKPDTPSSDKGSTARKRRPFECGDDSGSDSPKGSVSPIRTSSLRLSALDCNLGPNSPGPTSPSTADRLSGQERTSKLRAQLKKIPLPTEVMELFEKHEFEVCLLLRLLSRAPEQRPSAQDMRDELFKSLPRDTDEDKGTEMQKLRRELAELRELKKMSQFASGKYGLHLLPPGDSPPLSPGLQRPGVERVTLKMSQSEVNFRSLDGRSAR
jgi:serine/threonine protein kinase